MKSNNKGGITLFTILSLVLVMSCLLTLLEGARVYELHRMAFIRSQGALESAFAKYNTCLWENYHLLGNSIDGAKKLLKNNWKYLAGSIAFIILVVILVNLSAKEDAQDQEKVKQQEQTAQTPQQAGTETVEPASSLSVEDYPEINDLIQRYFDSMANNDVETLKQIFFACEDIRRIGSAAIELAYVAAGRVDIYLERNLKPWDFAAAIGIIEEAGGIITDYEGLPIDISKPSDILAGNKVVHQKLRENVSL